MRREAAVATRTLNAKAHGTKGKEILDNGRIDQILDSLEPSTTNTSTTRKKKH